ncbi:DUF3267 domain-containing protein [Staphylococcus sp. SQ8-PEA]|uniref:DUF3267 domain-containing protein n=1 Tax=Staphylococcus marylandisciuri TaxID=2981529 RepID=A0ABT2QS49_9STAP|nr:DUF3267 domain-containing protein [Staphylococcus marylandisciuri]MCU5746805.1 DUF3267 domain-containing protein [Staphylococcus marylandisciuri]
MFLCTRQIDINARFGLPRIAFLGFVTTIISFLICYEIMHYYSDVRLSDHYFLVFIVAAILLYPFHKIFHLFFLLPYYHSFRIYKINKKKSLPFYNVYVNTPVNKYYFALGLILPFILITLLGIMLTVHFLAYGHYFMFLVAMNMGFSVLDFLYIKIILLSNEGNYIEEHQTGINILRKVKVLSRNV